MAKRDGVQIPFTVIGGFLGAGKTTYLNALIKSGLPSNALLIVNDFGDINIDAELIDYQDDNIMQLSNGCVCCTLGGTLAEQLASALRVRSAPNAIVIEASGVADPARIADIAKLSRRLRLAEIVCVIDGSHADKHAMDPLIGDVWHAQVAAADLLHVNRLSTSHKADVLELLQSINPTGTLELDMVRVVRKRQPIIRQNDRMERSAQSYDKSGGNTDTHDSDSWHSFSLTGKTAVDRKTLVTLIKSYDDVLFRVKGFVFIDDEVNARLLQFSGDQISLQPTLRHLDRNQLVFIGIAGERLNALQRTIEGLLKPESVMIERAASQ